MIVEGEVEGFGAGREMGGSLDMDLEKDFCGCFT